MNSVTKWSSFAYDNFVRLRVRRDTWIRHPDRSFDGRPSLSSSQVHRPRQAGISGGGQEGADSIVVSGGYEDDEDYGNSSSSTPVTEVTTPLTGRQVADQTFSVGNRALAVSCDEGLPVRVIRGAGGDPRLSPPTGYRYDGLYSVQRYWHEEGRSGSLFIGTSLRL